MAGKTGARNCPSASEPRPGPGCSRRLRRYAVLSQELRQRMQAAVKAERAEAAAAHEQERATGDRTAELLRRDAPANVRGQQGTGPGNQFPGQRHQRGT